jgi:hypothetical protein
VKWRVQLFLVLCKYFCFTVAKIKSYCCEECPSCILETLDFQHIIIKEAYCLVYVIPLGQFVWLCLLWVLVHTLWFTNAERLLFNSFLPCSSCDCLQFKSCCVSMYVTEILLDTCQLTWLCFCSYLCSQIVLLLRLVPLLPFNMLNYLLSVTPVGIVEYMLASWIGMMVCSKCFPYLCNFQSFF